MSKSRTKRAMKTPLKEYEGRLVTNFVVRTQTPVALDRDKVHRAFSQAQARFPGMSRPSFPSDKGEEKDEYKLSEQDRTDPTEPLRTLFLAERRLAIAACHPLSSAQQRDTIQELVKVLDALHLVKPITIDYVDMRFVFEFKYLGNHHGRILDILFKGSCLHQLSKDVGGEPADFSPALMVRHPKDPSLRVVFEIRPRTITREIESGKYDGDEIAAICSTAKVRDFGPGLNLAKIHTALHRECLKIVTESYLPAVVEPLHRELGA